MRRFKTILKAGFLSIIVGITSFLINNDFVNSNFNYYYRDFEIFQTPFTHHEKKDAWLSRVGDYKHSGSIAKMNIRSLKISYQYDDISAYERLLKSNDSCITKLAEAYRQAMDKGKIQYA